MSTLRSFLAPVCGVAAAPDMVDDRYVIEPVGEGRVRLSLVSSHRLTTRFNGYGGLWTDLLMRDLQMYILRIVKDRAERAA